MRLSYIKIIKAESCGGLLDGLVVNFDRPVRQNSRLSPICFVGPNGSGKSQFLQIIAEIFQSAWNTCAPTSERSQSNPKLLFEATYEIAPDGSGNSARVRLSRKSSSKKAQVKMEILSGETEKEVSSASPEFISYLPSSVVGYTSGENETMSLPFFISRAGYAKDVREAALDKVKRSKLVPDNRLMLIDYGTHLEVLIANLMLGSEPLRAAILQHANLKSLSSWRCIIQLAHSAITKTKAVNGRRGVKLTEELEGIIENLQSCSTSWSYEKSSETYIFDFFVDGECRKAFHAHWQNAAALYKAFHKLAMLNDLAIPKKARSRLQKDLQKRHFAARLPEPQDESKVFRFEEVRFHRTGRDRDDTVDYVSLSDGEHQQAQIFGVFSMMTEANTLFLLDEPESHFNPLWRVKFISRLLELPTDTQAFQEVILTSHAPFVPSDMSRHQVLVFSKNGDNLEATNPRIETFGATFDRILQHCFHIQPPISQLARNTIAELRDKGTAEEIEVALTQLGPSVEKTFLTEKLRQLKTVE